MATEPLPDPPALRQGRRERLFAAMARARPRRARARPGRQHPLRLGGADPLERRHPPVRSRVRGRAGDRGGLPPEHLGRGRPRGDPPRPPVRDHLEPDELRHPPPGHRRRRRAPPGRHRRHVAAVRPAVADGLRRGRHRRRRSRVALPPAAPRPPTRSRPSGPPSRWPRRPSRSPSPSCGPVSASAS